MNIPYGQPYVPPWTPVLGVFFALHGTYDVKPSLTIPLPEGHVEPAPAPCIRAFVTLAFSRPRVTV